MELWLGDVGFVAELEGEIGNQDRSGLTVRVELTGPGGVGQQRSGQRRRKTSEGASLGGPWGAGPQARPLSAVWDWMLPQSRLPGPSLPKPRPHPGRAPGAGRGDQAGGGGRAREARARASLAAVREQRAPAARVAIFSPSVRLSAVGFVRLQRRPSAHCPRLGPQLPLRLPGPVPESPAWPARAAARGPLSGGPSVRRRGPGTRSAAQRRGAG